MKIRPPFLRFLDEFLMSKFGNSSQAAKAIGTSAATISRLVDRTTGQGTPKAIEPFLEKLLPTCNQKEKNEVMHEYLNHRAWTFNPDWYGSVSVDIRDTGERLKNARGDKTKQLIHSLIELSSVDPETSEKIASGVLVLLKAGLPPTTPDLKVAEDKTEYKEKKK